MKSARIVRPKESLEVQDVKVPKPKGSQVLVRVLSSGVCHSDVHLWEGGYEGPERQFLKTTDRGIKYPLTPGHEIAGIVQDIGEDATPALVRNEAITKEEEVIIYPWIGDGVCPACRMGEENLCDYPRSLGIYTDGGYAEYVLVPHYRYLVKINTKNNSIGKSSDDPHLDTDIASTLPCSVLTAYGAINNAALKPNDNVVVVGVGGLGLMAIQLAKAVTGAKVIAVDLDDDKLTIAKQNGADVVINSRNDDPVKVIKEMTERLGADAVIDFVNSTKSTETDMQLLRRRARLVFVGLFGGELKLNLVTMPTRAYRLIGSYTGSLNDLIQLASLARRGIIKPLVSNRFNLNQATEALQMLKDGKIVGRGVINP
ncbi:MAG: zinc-binding dehydrogenase [Thermoproteota archaeon]|nr:zinc-binding dehydrogenase [Thermoproteota archaeon]